MTTSRRATRWFTALIPIAAVISIDAANGNHYILPCNDACEAVAGIPIGAGMTGTWFDPAQAGHGLVIQVLPTSPKQMLVSWFAFAPDGGQTWITGRGPIEGTRTVLEAFQVVGGGARFPPNFDAAKVGQVSWGTLAFKFTNCTHGHVWWDSTAPGYGSGHLDLVRLTLPAGLECHVDGTGSIEGADVAPK